MAELQDDLCDVPGLAVGHETDLAAGTGCTVVLCPPNTLGAVDVRGGAPATRETDLLHPLAFMREVHAILLTGGSAFGLEAASGVLRELESRGIGFDTGVARVPIVPAAALFDLALGRADVRPDVDSGVRATQAAQSGPIALGTVGAGTGATVGKMGGPSLAVKGGLGSASARLPDGHTVAALVAVNAVGDVYDEDTGKIVAGARNTAGTGWLASETAPVVAPAPPFTPGTHTTLAVVATDAPFAKAELAKLAQMAHDGLARAIRPVHTPMDGDVVFALSTVGDGASGGQTPSWQLGLALAGAFAARTLSRAVVKAVRTATSLHGLPALRDLPFAAS